MSGIKTRFITFTDPLNPGRVTHFREQFWFTQSKANRRRNIPLPYTMSEGMLVRDTSSSLDARSTCPGFDPYASSFSYNKAYSKFIDAIGTQSHWGANFAEYKRSIDMIQSRSLKLYYFSKSLKRLEFRNALSALGLSRDGQIPVGVRSKSKAFADNFLEFRFGWEPLIKDIGLAVDTLQKPVPSGIVFGRGSFDRESKSSFSNGNLNYKSSTKISSKTLIKGKSVVYNPNLYVANQLGFANPLSVAWELVPFSFIVDWFVNVSQCLDSFTDLMGLDVSNPFVTTYQVASASDLTFGSQPDGYPYFGSSLTRESFAKSAHVRRVVGAIPAPTLRLKPYKAPSLIRGLTAISLLLQQLRR